MGRFVDTSVVYVFDHRVRGRETDQPLAGDADFVNHTTSGVSSGLALGLVNIAEGDFKGAQFGTVNYNAGSFEGVQWGFVHHTMSGDGLQLGFLNYAQKIHGIQIGLINIISQDGFLPVFPFVNWSF
ncbi:MAG: LA_2272 family surface repeat-containing protein [Gammaproteobacteria bacterium]